jgi:hypothetical protein
LVTGSPTISDQMMAFFRSELSSAVKSGTSAAGFDLGLGAGAAAAGRSAGRRFFFLGRRFWAVGLGAGGLTDGGGGARAEGRAANRSSG